MLIAISGLSGSGKTTFAEKLKKELPCKIGIINTDSYYKSFETLSKQERDKLNFDEPSMLDLELFHSQVKKLKQGNSVEIPYYNFFSHLREKKVNFYSPLPVNIIEGIFALCFPEINSLYDYKIFIDTPIDICLARRIIRDVEQRGRSVGSVIEQYFNSVRPMAIKYIMPCSKNADIILSNSEEHFSNTLIFINDKLNQQ